MPECAGTAASEQDRAHGQEVTREDGVRVGDQELFPPRSDLARGRVKPGGGQDPPHSRRSDSVAESGSARRGCGDVPHRIVDGHSDDKRADGMPHHPDGRVTPFEPGRDRPAQILVAADQVDPPDIPISNAGIWLFDDLTDRAAVDRHLAVKFLFGDPGVPAVADAVSGVHVHNVSVNGVVYHTYSTYARGWMACRARTSGSTAPRGRNETGP
jgi:hypothetical protein